MDKMNWLKLLSAERLGNKKPIKDADYQLRSSFEQDFDRIIFSHPFRRLQDKTQVFPLPEHDFVHTRLTHSLEVSSVGKSLGRKAGQRIVDKHDELTDHNIGQVDFGAITAAASLVHDLGNPPFGHAGEEAISDFFRQNPAAEFCKSYLDDKQWMDLCNFEGNAQGFRILNKGSFQGLNLTLATLGAFTKYPRESLMNGVNKARKSQKKYGFFQSEKQRFSELANEVGLIPLGEENESAWCRHPLAFLVEAADDICYSLIDLEDGCRLGLVSYDQTKQFMAAILQERFKEEKLEKIANLNERISILRAISIGVLIDECIAVFDENEDGILNGAFDKALTDLIPSKEVLGEISSLSIDKIYRSRIVLETEAAGFEILNGLLESFIPAAFAYRFDKKQCSGKMKSIVRLLPNEIFIGSGEENKEYNLIMNVVDFISGMTDSYAISLYRKIKGIMLPSGFPTNF